MECELRYQSKGVRRQCPETRGRRRWKFYLFDPKADTGLNQIPVDGGPCFNDFRWHGVARPILNLFRIQPTLTTLTKLWSSIHSHILDVRVVTLRVGLFRALCRARSQLKSVLGQSTFKFTNFVQTSLNGLHGLGIGIEIGRHRHRFLLRFRNNLVDWTQFKKLRELASTNAKMLSVIYMDKSTSSSTRNDRRSVTKLFSSISLALDPVDCAFIGGYCIICMGSLAYENWQSSFIITSGKTHDIPYLFLYQYLHPQTELSHLRADFPYEFKTLRGEIFPITLQLCILLTASSEETIRFETI